MRCEMLRVGLAPAVAALIAFVHPPLAQAAMFHAGICGSEQGIDLLRGRMPRKPGGHDPSCPTGCHATCSARKRPTAIAGALPEHLD